MIGTTPTMRRHSPWQSSMRLPQGWRRAAQRWNNGGKKDETVDEATPASLLKLKPLDFLEVQVDDDDDNIDDEDSDTQSCSDSGSEQTADTDKSMGDEIDGILDAYLSVELQPKTVVETVTLSTPDDHHDVFSNSSTLKKRVRIAIDKCTGDVVCRLHDDWHPRAKEKHKASIWYSKVDYDRFKRDNHQEWIAARQESSFVEDLVQLYDACRSYETMTDKLISSEEHIWRLCQSPHRGLEGAALCVTLFIARKSYIRQVLATQEQHKSLDGTCFTLLERADALAVQAQYLTQQARRMAQVLAAGDAIYATTAGAGMVDNATAMTMKESTAAAVSSTDTDDDDVSVCSYNSTDTVQC